MKMLFDGEETLCKLSVILSLIRDVKAKAINTLFKLEAVDVFDNDENEYIFKSIGYDKSGEIIQQFLKRIKDINQTYTKEQSTLAHAAALAQNLNAAKILLANGADFTIRDRNSLLPIEYFFATTSGKFDINFFKFLYDTIPPKFLDNNQEYGRSSARTMVLTILQSHNLPWYQPLQNGVHSREE